MRLRALWSSVAWHNLTASDVIIPRSGFTVKSDSKAVYNGMLKMINFDVIPAAFVTSNEITIGTLSSALRPRVSYSIISYSDGKLIYVDIYPGGTVNVNTLENTISANANIWVRATFA